MKPSSIVRLVLARSKPYAGPLFTPIASQNHIRQPSHFSRSRHTKTAQWFTNTHISLLFLATGFLASGLYFRGHQVHADVPVVDDEAKAKLFRLAEVKQHGGQHERPWVILGTRVYDITEWIPAHPGGEVILRAAGSSIDQFWDIFSIHKTKDTYDILESYYIGNIDPKDLNSEGKVPSDSIEDPFADDPVRDRRLITLTPRPCNAETPIEGLSSYITPSNLFYVRQHLWVPPAGQHSDVDHTLTIELPDGEEATYTVADLKSLFKPVTISATLQCSGNRRAHSSTSCSRNAQGLAWKTGAISNATWTGVRLRDVLIHAGFPVDTYDDPSANSDHDESIRTAKHVQFSGLEAYGSSIPLGTATDRHADVLLAYEMNGKPLPPDHGAPLRALVPGIVAARSVKWLSKIVISDEESTSQWQRRDYKCFGPNLKKIDKGKEAIWDEAPAIQEMPVQSAITGVSRCADARSGEIPFPTRSQSEEEKPDVRSGHVVEVTGYAYSGAGRRIVRVDISADNGQTWQQAELLAPKYEIGDDETADNKTARLPQPAPSGSKAWAWTRWRYLYHLPQSSPAATSTTSERKPDLSPHPSHPPTPSQDTDATKENSDSGTIFVVKAVDEGYNTQPESYEAIWNFRGNLTNAWHRVKCPEDICGGATESKGKGDGKI